MLMNGMRRLPMDVILFAIIPYTYSPQPKDHLLNIRSFVSELRMIDSVYATQYNYNIFLYDLMSFIEGSSLSITVDMDPTILSDEKRVQCICRRLWGKLTTIDRSRFISRFLLDDF